MYLCTMITDSIIKKKFIHEQLKRGISQIYSAQEKVITGELDARSGRLRQWASVGAYDMRIGSSGDYTINVRFLPYLRFIDMMYRTHKDRVSRYKRAQTAVYNRVIWGIFYRKTFPAIRFGFTDEVRQGIKERLEKTFRN